LDSKCLFAIHCPRFSNTQEIQAYIGILIYMGLVDLPEFEDYFFSSTYISYENAIGTKRTAVALQGQIEKIGQQNLGKQLFEIEKVRIQENVA